MADSGAANLLYLQVLVEVSRDSFLCDLLWSLLRWLCLIDDNLVRGVGLGETFEYIIERNSIESPIDLPASVGSRISSNTGVQRSLLRMNMFHDARPILADTFALLPTHRGEHSHAKTIPFDTLV